MEAAREGTPSSEASRKRERILMSALRVFGRRGFHQATMEEVAREAGVGKGTIYLYVPSKDALLQEAIRHLAEEQLRRGAEVATGGGTALERMGRLLELEGRFLLSHRDVAQAILHDRTGIGYGADMRATLTEMHRRRTKLYSRLVREAQAAGLLRRSLPAARLAMALIGMNTRLLLHALIEDRAADPHELATFCLNLFLEGAAPARRTAPGRR